MPDWSNYFYSYTTGTSTSSDTFASSYVPLTTAQMQHDYEEYQREQKRQDQIYEQQMQMHEQQMEKERQLIKDKEKYPLFFWRETCAKGTLKEGIV